MSKSIKRRGIKNWFNIKKKRQKNRSINLSVGYIIMGEKTLKFNNIKVNKKEFHRYKQAIDLNWLFASLVIKKMKLLNHYVLSYLK